jgi:hypothetical protein
MGDLDLWLSVEDMIRARAALTGMGYVEANKTRRPPELQFQQDGEVQMLSREPGRGLVELHWSAFSGQWLWRTAIDRAGILCRAIQVMVVGRPAWTLAPEDAIIQLAVHQAINHQMSYPGLRGLLDLVLLARSRTLDWSAVVDRARTWRVATVTWLVLQLAHNLLGFDEAASALRSLQPSLQRRRLLAAFTDETRLLAGHDMTGGPQRLLFQLLLVDRGREAARLIGRTLWPERAWLAARYGAAGLPINLRHFVGAIRGRV